jgi:hypothetical protein
MAAIRRDVGAIDEDTAAESLAVAKGIAGAVPVNDADDARRTAAQDQTDRRIGGEKDIKTRRDGFHGDATYN